MPRGALDRPAAKPTAIVILRLRPQLLSTISQCPHQVMPSPHLQTTFFSEQAQDGTLQAPVADAAQRQPTPPPPAYSPVTPEMPPAILAAPLNTYTSSNTNPYSFAPPAASSPDPISSNHAHPQPRLHLNGPAPLAEPPQPPAPEPISLEENTDAIALRAAISVLQMQRQRALQDMVTLEKQKRSALENVEGFVTGLVDKSITVRDTKGVLPRSSVDDEEEEEDEQEDAQGQMNGTVQQRQQHEPEHGGLGQMEIPSAQNVVRMPPINWQKYHVIGESLDRLHKDQKIRPTAGIPEGTRKETEVAAPYDPFVDTLDPTSKAEPASRGISGVSNGPLVEGMSTRRKSGGGKRG